MRARPSGRHRADRGAQHASHLEGLAPELEPGQWIMDGAVYRIERVPSSIGGWPWEVPVVVRRFAPPRGIFDPVANARAALRIIERSSELRR